MTSKQPRSMALAITALIAFAIAALVAEPGVSLWIDGAEEPAQVLHCDRKWSAGNRRSGSTRARSVIIKNPVAYTEDGAKATGQIWLPGEWCERMLGGHTSVLVHPADKAKNQIKAPLQMWGITSIPLYIGVLLDVAWFRVGRRKLTWLVTAISWSGLAAGTYAQLNAPGALHASAERSAGMLSLCIRKAMLDKGLNREDEVQRLVCQNEWVTELSRLKGLTNLEELYLQRGSFTSLQSIAPLPRLRILSVASNPSLTSLDGIENLPALEELQANKSGIKSLNGVQSLTQLRTVALMSNQIDNAALQVFANLRHLEDVILNYNNVSDIRPLANKPNLRRLQIYSNRVSDITPLMDNTQMELVGVRGAADVPCAQIDALRKRLATTAKVWGPKQCGES